ncbi:SGNH/GDSL hydrolase family protein [Sphingomonas sp. MMS24-J13]|uniref:SGNH/GDSL hydrolase family protein n=1 Tax=Sphingomonas sp. MMS24-J13 TaxID=3238686 RepID=UPI00384A75A4
MRRRLLCLSIATALTGCGSGEQTAAPMGKAAVDAQPMVMATAGKPLVDTSILGEARLFRGGAPVVLLYPPERVKAVYSFDDRGRKLFYREGRDWQRTRFGLARTTGSRIPDFGTYRYSTAKGCQAGWFTRNCVVFLATCAMGKSSCKAGNADGSFEFRDRPRNPPLMLGYNVYIDYDAKLADFTIRSLSADLALARNVACVGDSIASGAHTVDSLYFNNDRQSWCGLLRKYFNGTKKFKNFAVPGSDIRGFDVAKLLAADRPDAVVLAFGMNDHAVYPNADRFREQLRRAIRQLKANHVRVLTVGFFQQNKLWKDESVARTKLFNTIIADVSREQAVPFVDILTKFGKFQKRVADPVYLVADFMHHPNLYGQRIYFSAILPYFLERDLRATAVPDYVIGTE